MDRVCVDCGTGTSSRKPEPRCHSCAAKHMWRTRQPKREFQEYRGVRYYKQDDGYWRAGRHSGGELMHRAVWEGERGPIPEGWHVHHKDHDPSNNDVGNLEPKPAGEHAEHHYPTALGEWVQDPAHASRRSASARTRKRILKDLVCDECASAFQSVKSDARFCNPTCNSRWWNRERAARRAASRL